MGLLSIYKWMDSLENKHMDSTVLRSCALFAQAVGTLGFWGIDKKRKGGRQCLN